MGTMNKNVYRQLLEVMKKRGGLYAGLDIPEFFEMVEAMFTPEEAEVNNAMPRGRITAKAMAELMGRNEGEIYEILESMANKGLCRAYTEGGEQIYESARFFPGIVEDQLMSGKNSEREKKIARLVKAYTTAYNANTDPVVLTFPTTRVLTVDSFIEAKDNIHTYDQVQTYIDQHDRISVSVCYCRHAAVLREEDIHGMPTDVCMHFGDGAQYTVDRLGCKMVTKEEAREALDRSEAAGLIHMSQNWTDDITFICNCDRWHCGIVTMILAQPKPGRVFNSGFEPKIDPDKCSFCEVCTERCPPKALTLNEDNALEVNFDRCFGCAACATGCSEEAITMVKKSGHPEIPKNTKALREAVKASSTVS